jgi:hypothetical protein
MEPMKSKRNEPGEGKGMSKLQSEKGGKTDEARTKEYLKAHSKRELLDMYNRAYDCTEEMLEVRSELMQRLTRARTQAHAEKIAHAEADAAGKAAYDLAYGRTYRAAYEQAYAEREPYASRELMDQMEKWEVERWPESFKDLDYTDVVDD